MDSCAPPPVTGTAKKKPRLSGWTRLWVVTTVLSSLSGGANLAMSPEPPQWPSTFSDATSRFALHLLSFLGPLVVAALWIAIRWVWRGFRPLPDEASAPHIGTIGLARQVLRLLAKVGAALCMLAFAIFWGLSPILLLGRDPAIWAQLYIMFHLLVAVWIVGEAWKLLTLPAHDPGDSGSG